MGTNAYVEHTIRRGLRPGARIRRPHENRVVSVSLDVLLQVLRTLEGLATEVTTMRLQRDMNTDVRCDMITLDRRGMTVCPLTGEIEIVGAFTANMAFADVLLWRRLLSVMDARHDETGTRTTTEGVLGRRRFSKLGLGCIRVEDCCEPCGKTDTQHRER